MTDAYPTDDLPVMAPDRAQVETWLRVLTLGSELLRGARIDMKLDAFSEAEQAAVDHDRVERSALDPGVIPMTDLEQQLWRETSGRAEEHRVTDPAGAVRVRVGPLRDGRWAMDATITPLAGDPTPTSTVAVSCQTEQLAREIADEVLAIGPDPDVLDRLARHATQRGARHTDATSQVREPEHDRLTRTRAAIRQAWSPALAERVIAAQGFPTLAARLHELEERGDALPDVLGRISQAQLSGPTVRDPARLAGWLCQKLTVVEGQVSPDTTPPATPQTRHAPEPSPTEAAMTAAEQRWRHTAAEDIVWPALRDALPEQLHDTLRASSGYDHLVDDLCAKQATGWSLETLLTQLPTDKITEAGDPARYLSAIISNRAAQTTPARAGIDKVAMAAIVRDALPAEVATRVLDCPAWPALAKTMAQSTSHQPAPGVAIGQPPLREILAGMPLDAIGRARKPAAYTAKLLTERLAARGSATGVPAEAPTARRDRTTPMNTPFLDPASAINRITLEDTGRDVSTAHAHLPEPRRTTTDPGAGASHLNAFEQASGMAADAELAAGVEHANSDTPGLSPNPDADGSARVDDNLAAGFRAAAAEELGAANAAVLRAEAVFTPPTPTAQSPSVSRGQQPAFTQARLRIRENTPDRNRTR